jgi:hypothetical protein
MSDSKDSNQLPPPLYSSTAESTPSTSPTPFSPANLHQQPLAIDYAQYRIEGAALGNDRVAVLARDERFSHDPQALLQLMDKQAQLPPKLLVRVRGSHSVYGEIKRDFDLTLNLLPLLVSESERWSYLKIDGSRVTVQGEPVPPAAGSAPSDLEKLVVQYCEDPATVKR